jgi:hypothetical protein
VLNNSKIILQAFAYIREIEKTDIQRAAKVRSTKGILTFGFGRIAAAFISLIF